MDDEPHIHQHRNRGDSPQADLQHEVRHRDRDGADDDLRACGDDHGSTLTSSVFPGGLALSTANLYTAVQPGGSLFGLQESNPVSTDVAYGGDPSKNGTADDPMFGGRIGGINVFGGGLALYRASDGKLLGGIGVSGDSSCADHNIAWKTRALLNLDNIPGGVDPASGTDNIVYDITNPGNSQAIAPKSASGWGHPQCSAAATAIGNALPTTFPVGPGPQP